MEALDAFLGGAEFLGNGFNYTAITDIKKKCRIRQYIKVLA